jgi:hypothetical protein
MAVMRFTETTVITYQSTMRNIPEEYLYQRLCEDIISFNNIVFTSHFFPMPSERHTYMFDW